MSNFFFDLDRKPPENPAISVICLNKNHEKFLEDTILSVFAQRYDDFEFVIADGGSTDASLEIIGRHKFITLVTGKDTCREEGVMRALAAARGRYIMFTTSTDGYLSRDWFSSAADVLDKDPEVTLVFGASALLSGNGALQPCYPAKFPFHKVPQKHKWPRMWLLGGFGSSYLPELNYCVRADIFKRLIAPSPEFPEFIDPILRFHFEFNRQGYLPFYLPTLANFGRSHDDQSQFSPKIQADMAIYIQAWKRYRQGVLSGKFNYMLRDGHGQIITQSPLQPLVNRLLLLLSLVLETASLPYRLLRRVIRLQLDKLQS